MQQKYCDHGRSVALLSNTRPTFLARSSCPSGGKARKASILPSARSCFASGRDGNPVDVPPGIESDRGRDAGEKDVRRRSERQHGRGLSLQVADGPDLFGNDQLEAADMDPRQKHDRRTHVHRDGQRRREVHRKVDRAGAERLRARYATRSDRSLSNVLDLGEAFGAQQLFRNILRRETHRPNLAEAKAGGFRRWLGVRGLARHADQAGRTGSAEEAKHSATFLVHAGPTP